MDTPVEHSELIPEAEWNSPMFNLAQQQFLQASRIMGLDDTSANA